MFLISEDIFLNCNNVTLIDCKKIGKKMPQGIEKVKYHISFDKFSQKHQGIFVKTVPTFFIFILSNLNWLKLFKKYPHSGSFLNFG